VANTRRSATVRCRASNGGIGNRSIVRSAQVSPTRRAQANSARRSGDDARTASSTRP